VKRYLVPLVLLSVVVLICAAAMRVHVSGRRELHAGRTARDMGDLVKAQAHFLFAARWYLPFVATSPTAITELMAVGEAYLEQKDYPRAVSAYDDARGALFATAWLMEPDDKLLNEANEGYAYALSLWKKQRQPAVDRAAHATRYAQLARDVPLRNPWWLLAMGLSFLAYVGCLGVVAWRWDRLGTGKWMWLGGAGVSFGLWVVSLILI